MDFDQVINRRGTGSMKWNKYPEDVTPMWVADMDFPAPQCVQEALQKAVNLNIYGYSLPRRELISVIIERLWQKYNWEVKPSSIVWLPGLVSALNIAARGCVQNNRSIITHTPVYPPFLEAPQLSARKLVTQNLIENNSRYEIDFENFGKICSPATELYYLCNPQNPTGRVFDRDELQKIGEICLQKKLFICSDEIHNDLILADKTHTPIATLSPEIRDITITLMSPSKTFNVPGLGFAFAIIENYNLRKRFLRAMEGIVPYPNLTGLTAAESAYRDGEPWRLELLIYLRNNQKIVQEFIKKEMPEIGYIPGEATYLAWLDLRKLKLSNPYQYFLDHKVALSNGKDFGGEGFLRLNFGCPKSLLLEGLNKIKTAYDKI